MSDRILIIGTGFAGLGMGIRLKQAGIHDFVIVEQAAGVGGTWRANHYPGAACDVQSHLYSFSFEPNPKWSREFAPQKEILEYLEHCTDKYGLREHIRLQTSVRAATFDEATGLWEVRIAVGGDAPREETLRARVVVSGCGGLSRPALPDIPGLESFTGQMFHSARWDHDTPLEGKRVAVIGTGASSIQLVPQLQPKAQSLSVFQRSAAWITPKPDRAFTGVERALYARFPITQKLARLGIYWRREALAIGFVVEPRLLRALEPLSHFYRKRQVRDPELRRKLTPDYAMGCKRILPTNDFYRALSKPNVSLVTDGIERVTERGIRTSSGQEHAFDAIVLATGFEAAEAAAPFAITGKNGRDLNAEWRDGAEAYLGTTVAGFPNMFMIVGPNTGLGHSSMVFMIEAQIQYVLDAVKQMRKGRWKLVDVRPEVQTAYNERLHARLQRTIWASGCKSWYRTKSGKNTTLWPGFTFEYRLRTRRFDAESYQCVPLDAAAAKSAEPTTVPLRAANLVN